MSNYQPKYEWEHGHFLSPKQVCIICKKDTGEFRRLFWAGSYMNGDDEYILDMCIEHYKKLTGKEEYKRTADIEKHWSAEDIIRYYQGKDKILTEKNA